MIGTALCLLMLLLCGCGRIEYVYVEAPREPITCHRHMKTFLDMAKCLEMYKAKYYGLDLFRNSRFASVGGGIQCDGA